jgi:hypothetical protein
MGEERRYQRELTLDIILISICSAGFYLSNLTPKSTCALMHDSV